MKTIIIFTLLVSSLSAIADDGRELGAEKFYTIISDVFDEEIEEGHYEVVGAVHSFSSDLPVEKAEVNTLELLNGKANWSMPVYTDSVGKFKIVLPVGGQQLCAHHDALNETCIADYEFKEKHRIEVKIYLYRVIGHEKRKPLIYLYNEEAIKASIKLDPYGDFTFTYPKYETSWEVELTENNELKEQGEDRTYPYLFWEAESQGFDFIHDGLTVPGFIIKSDTAISFLESCLDDLSLNQTEKTDFITFWGPIIEQSDYSLLQFIVDEEYDKRVAKIEIDPKPDNIRRVYLVQIPLDSEDSPYTVEEQVLTSFDRSGFTILEWGGGQVDINNLKP